MFSRAGRHKIAVLAVRLDSPPHFVRLLFSFPIFLSLTSYDCHSFFHPPLLYHYPEHCSSFAVKMISPAFVLAMLPILSVMADIAPLTPAPGDVYKPGSACNIAWKEDSSGNWTTLNIELMTGQNEDMVHLTTVATLDGTKTSSFSYSCPEVSPNAAIYFYQFSTPSDPENLFWTGRFAISDDSGNTVDPSETADGVKWGTGALVNAANATAPPSYLNESTSSGSANSTSSSNSSSSTDNSTSTLTSSTSKTSSVRGALTATGSLTSSLITTPLSGAVTGSAASASSTSGSSSGASSITIDLQTRGLQTLVALGTAFLFKTIF